MIQTGTLEREKEREKTEQKSKKKKKREREREKAVQPESEENHFSMLLFHSPLISGCAVQLKQERNNMLNVFMLDEEKRRKYLPRKEGEKKGKQKIPHYVVIKNGK